MTQTRTEPQLQLQLIPMRISEISPPIDLDSAGYTLIAHPGEMSQLLVQAQNLSDRTLSLQVRLEGECPLSWYQINPATLELAPRQRIDVALNVQPPDDFFESQIALRPGDRLQLDYRSYVVVSFQDDRGQQYLDAANITVCVRPRTRYLQYLPVIYQEVDFIGRFLKIFEQAFNPVVQSLETMWANLDPLTAPEALIPFLSHWVGWNLEPHWTLVQQRRLIKNAMEIYRWRGTRRGLRLFLHFYTQLPLDEHLPEAEKHIQITEATYQPFSLGGSVMGEDTAIGRGRPFHFLVRLRPAPHHVLDEALVHRIILQEKPAFCTYELEILHPENAILPNPP